MKKYDIITEAQNFFSLKGDQVQVYPGQDYYLFPTGDQYGMPSRIPFPDRPGLVGVSCAFDCNGECCYIIKHSNWSKYFTETNLTTHNWKQSQPVFIVPLIICALNPDVESKLDLLALELMAELKFKAKPCENRLFRS